MAFLDNNGVQYLWGKIKSYVTGQVPSSVGELSPLYGTCATAQDTAAKVATVNGVTELTTGLTIHVRFSAANTIANPTLNVNSLGAVAIKRYGTTAPSTSAASSWNAGAVLSLTYDGTYWMLNDWNNTTYSALTEADMQTGTATTARLITAARLKQAVKYHAPVTSVNGSTGAVTVPSVPTGTNSDDMLLWDSTNQEWTTSAFASEVSFALAENVTVEQIMFTTDGTTVTSVDTSQECIIKAFNAKEKYFLIAISQTEVVACQPFYIAGNGAIFGLYAWKDGQIIYTFLTASSASAPYTGTLNTVTIPTTSSIESVVQNYVNSLDATGVSY